MGAEQDRVAGFGRMEDGLRRAGDWYRWGPYVSDRQWGTVREDYSPGGDAWNYLPHDHARSRAYRWGEDGIAGFCDIEQRLCLSLALWNGEDPILKERLFGLTSSQGNHGEDVKEYYWYADALPSHAYNYFRYHYPHREYPYKTLVGENGNRDRTQPEYELSATGVFSEDRYWSVDVRYAKASPDDILMSIQVRNAGPDEATLHVLPTAWFRNTWSWDNGSGKPCLATRSGALYACVDIEHPFLGPLELLAGPAPDGRLPRLLFCENETNTARLYEAPPLTPFPKDGINDHVLTAAPTVNPEQSGTKCAAWYQLTLAGGQQAELRLRLRPRAQPTGEVNTGADAPDDLSADFGQTLEQRKAEADEFYAGLTPAGCGPEEALVMRQAFAGLLWSKQLFYYDVARWLDGDPGQPVPPPERLGGRNSRWRGFDAFDIMSMPDCWEYPWFAAWDLAFQCVALAHVDPGFAKYQLILLCREWFQHPNGALPAYEWDFSDVNPPVQAWAALEVFAVDGGKDVDFLSRVFDKLLLNFTWWVNREDAEGNNLFEGGFLGLDNIGPIDRSHLPVGGILEQSDATGWMGSYSLAMAAIALVLDRCGQRPGVDLMLKFAEHFAAIRSALDGLGLWDEADGMYYDRLLTADGQRVPVQVRSVAGMIPALAAGVVDDQVIELAMTVGKRFAGFLGEVAGPAALADGGAAGGGTADGGTADGGTAGEQAGLIRGEPGHRRMLLSLAGPLRLQRLLRRLFDEAEFLSPHGLRALSAWHREHPYTIDVEGYRATIDYEPAESTTPLFGGNSNWRGPVWFPVNYLVISALERYQAFFGDDLMLEYPTGSGQRLTLGAISHDLSDRLISIFMPGADGRRPCYGEDPLLTSPGWGENVMFHEYFHGDTGAGLGASHQTGWTALVADLIRRKHGAVSGSGTVIARISLRARLTSGAAGKSSGT